MRANEPKTLSEAETEAARRKRILKRILVSTAALLAIVSLGYIFFFFGSMELSNSPSPAPSPTSGYLPEFPWPPRSSAYTKIPPQYLLKPEGQTKLKDVAARVETAFRSAGYAQTGYYSVPGGFALASQLEQFKPNGLSVDDPYRWSLQMQTPRLFSLEYLSALIKGRVGHYRVIVFVVSSDFFSQESGKRVDIEQAGKIAIEGANILPPEVGNLPFTDNHACLALVYEFEKSVPDKPARFKENSSLLAETHLQKILPYLQR